MVTGTCGTTEEAADIVTRTSRSVERLTASDRHLAGTFSAAVKTGARRVTPSQLSNSQNKRTALRDGLNSSHSCMMRLSHKPTAYRCTNRGFRTDGRQEAARTCDFKQNAFSVKGQHKAARVVFKSIDSYDVAQTYTQFSCEYGQEFYLLSSVDIV